MTEQTLHEQLKKLYARETGEIESFMGDFRVDVVHDNLLIEIQTSSFSSIKNKLLAMVRDNRVRLVHPIAYQKWIIRLDENRKRISRRKSPKRGRVEEVFNELIYIPELLEDKNFELEVLLVDLDEYWIDDGKGSWRRRRWSIHDRQMIELHEHHIFNSPEVFKKLIPEIMPLDFTSNMLSKKTGLNMRLIQKMLYCLTKIKVVERRGKRGRSHLYRMK